MPQTTLEQYEAQAAELLAFPPDDTDECDGCRIAGPAGSTIRHLMRALVAAAEDRHGLAIMPPDADFYLAATAEPKEAADHAD